MWRIVFSKDFIPNVFAEFERIYIFSPSFYQELKRKLNKCFSNYKPINLFPNILNEDDINLVIDEIVNDKDFEKTETEVETYDLEEELKNSQEYEGWAIFILNDSNEKGMTDPRIQAMFKRARHNNLSFFIISQQY